MTSSLPADRRARRSSRLPRPMSALAAGLVAATTLATVAAAGPAQAAGALSSSARVAAVGSLAAAVARPIVKLADQGCDRTGTVASCDLYALSGSTSVLGTAVPIWGFSGTSTAGSASAPGPLLVVNQGDTVSITLHNQLAGENVSLSLPGQTQVSATGLLNGDDVSGVGNGGTRTYTFTASRPGTYLYQAGHTDNGARQVAMGLAGALVVLASDGTANGNAFDDEAVVVLSEIDPALNAAPSSFDMRKFHPAYRLINGKAFPSTDPISTDQGRTVLLRYVNVGSQTHTMSLLGSTQTQVAFDGHPLNYSAEQVTAVLDPGTTTDSLVPVPAGPEAKLALFESAQHLDNNNQVTGVGSTITAFGGMMTFVDTNAPPPITDAVGPKSLHIAISPNPSNGLAPATVTADLSEATTGHSNVSGAEFLIDDFTTIGPGFGTAMTGTFGTESVTGIIGTISQIVLDGLSAGKHIVYVRGLDSAGNWGVVGSAVFNLPKTGPLTSGGSATSTPANGVLPVAISATGDDSAAGGTITDGEYYLESANPAPAPGTATHITPNRIASVVSLDASIAGADVAALGEGLHHVFIRSKDSLGLWGPVLDIPLPVDLHGPNVDAASVSPNPSNGIVTDKANPGSLIISASATDPNAGTGVPIKVVAAEAFLDPKVAVPTGGTGIQMLAVDAKWDSPTESVYGLIPISAVRALSIGVHTVKVRAKDAAGTWGPLFTVNLYVDKTAPVLGALAVVPGNTATGPVPNAALTLTAPLTETAVTPGGALLQAAEVWIGTTDPGAGKGTKVPFTTVGGNVSVTMTGPATSNQVNLRVQDMAGNWSNVVFAPVVVYIPNAIFGDTFDAGTFAAWAASTGGVSVTAAAGIPVGGTNMGFQLTLPGGAANAASFLTDNTPAAETAYKAKFAFNPNTLTTGSAVGTAMTLFEARSATNARVFTVQYHRTNQGPAQVRIVMARSGGLGALTSAYLPVTGASTIQVDWLAGPAALGAGQGSLVLTVTSGTVVNTVRLAGNTSTLRVDTAVLGAVAGFTRTATGSSAGTAYIDSFVSARFTL